MAQAGYCAVCQSNVWLRTDGSCANGHAASCVSNAHDAGTPTAVPAPVRKRRVWRWVLGGIAVLLLCPAIAFAGFLLFSVDPSGRISPNPGMWLVLLFFLLVVLPLQFLWLKLRKFLWDHGIDWIERFDI